MTTHENAPPPEGWVPTPRSNPFAPEPVIVIPANVVLSDN